ncbi:SPOR domain-containing protein [Sphingomonas sp. CJ20]
MLQAGLSAPAGAGYAAPLGEQQAYPEPVAGAGSPRGSSQPQDGEQRYDEIGYAAVQPGAPDDAVTGAHKLLAPNSIVEVTALDSGRTILVLVTGPSPDSSTAIALSAGAARELGYTGDAAQIPVRVRKVAATAGDMLALRSGRPASARPDTPPILLTALRKRLPAIARPAPVLPAARPVAAPRRPAPVQAARPVSVRGGYYVQVAALSNARNAQALAQSMGGFVKQGGGLHRVQLGPFANQREAEVARAGAARAGYGDARVFAVH